MKTLASTTLVVFCIISSHVGSAPAAATDSIDHLVPVNEDEMKDYQAKLHAKLFITPADVARMCVLPAWESEFAVSVYARPRLSKNNVAKYYVTLTRASKSIWDSPEPIGVIRHDAELPEATALAIKRIWKQMLFKVRPYEHPMDSPVDNAIVQFALLEPNKSGLSGELPINPTDRVLALRQLGDLLVDYCKASTNQRAALAMRIEKAAKDLLRGSGR